MIGETALVENDKATMTACRSHRNPVINVSPAVATQRFGFKNSPGWMSS